MKILNWRFFVLILCFVLFLVLSFDTKLWIYPKKFIFMICCHFNLWPILLLGEFKEKSLFFSSPILHTGRGRRYAIGKRLLKVLTTAHVVRCAVCYHLDNLKNMKNTHGGVLILVKLILVHRCFFTFFELYKWYQIVQRITHNEQSFPWLRIWQRSSVGNISCA